MASSKRKRKKKPRKASGATGSGDPRVAEGAESHLDSLFKLVFEVTETADRAMPLTPNPSDRLVRFDMEILARAINSMKSVYLLLRSGHWEHASGITRQLFELLVNMEYLGKQPSRWDATLLYCRFGLLQMALEHHRKAMYNKETGRYVDERRVAFLEKILDGSFDDFKGKPRPDGTTRWVTSWNRKNTKEMSDLSSDRMRPKQYVNLFASWSEQAHATPGSLMDNLFRDMEEDWWERAMESDTQKIVETASMALLLFLSLWRELPHAFPLPREQANAWTRRMMEIVAAPEFDALPGYRVGG
ncbi:DUF5677 domain-containing protein [Streptomyces anulatus]|uniref:DUF5677 domain-containing protein n=1 Tax=Streptomyces anulatus TaxID=1892 RepID=UPI0022536F5F|nr:DUF5677 domain-containing protein [Streptomyces anulatus]MCX4504578.1 DUF5677 domain-containing protein [Streptomyces anulatus]